MTYRGARAAIAIAALLLAGCAAPAHPRAAEPQWRTPAAATADAAAALPRDDVSGEVSSRVAAGVAPPTNRWYSGMVFGDTPQTVHPFPLAVTPRDDGFSLGLPDVQAGPDSIAAATTDVLDVTVDATAYTVVRAGPVSVTAAYAGGGTGAGELTLAEGWPVAGFVATSDTVLTSSATLKREADGVWSATVGAQLFGVVADGASATGSALRLPAGRSAQWFAVPADSSVSAWAAALSGPVTDVEVEAGLGAGDAATRLTYSDEPTVLVPFPTRDVDAAACGLGTFDTVYGPASACAAASLEWSVPLIAPAGAYDLAGLDADAAQALSAQVAADLASTGALPTDTYFGGKALARLATLLDIAVALGDDGLAGRVADRLWHEFAPWADPAGCAAARERCFVYDEHLRLVVGLAASFGSEQANDHHFHYGYFLAAAASLAAARPELVAELSPVVDALAADIAAGAPGGALPALRVFDPYRGHSWASGLSPFRDGNNQESSSEAVAAWNGLARWAEVTGQDDLAHTATWLLSSEAAAARALWLEPSGLPSEYGHGIVSMTWGAKRDYATWFSAEPSAILGIQLLPLGPVSLEYLAGDPERVAANVAEAGGAAAFSGPLGDQVAMYSALAGPDGLDAADRWAAGLGVEDLDDGTSLSGVLAWLAAVRLAQ